MKRVAKIVVVLSLAGLFSGLLLALVSNYATPFIEQNRRKELRKAIFQIFPRSERFESHKEGDRKIYEVFDSSGNTVGYGIIEEGAGYQGKIRIMIGLDTSINQVEGIVILESKETPGLGGKITEKEFRSQFKDLELAPDVQLVKNKPENQGEVQAITGATISSKAVVSIVNSGVSRLEKLTGRRK